jgi:proline-specific peptidase
MAHSFPTAEGFIEYTPYTAGKPCRTWYKVHGDLKLGVRPLVIVHGGPGLSHDYMLSLTDLACPPYNIPLVFYDQIGCGQSTHLPDKNRDYGFWTEQLFLDQLTTVLRHFGIEDDYDLLGHSWGGMLASTHTARQPLGLKNLVLASTPVSGQAWMNAYKRYREMMPENYKEELMRPREFDLPDTPEYQEAIHAFLVKHFCSLNPMPEECLRSFQHAGEDPTVVLSTYVEQNLPFPRYRFMG